MADTFETKQGDAVIGRPTAPARRAPVSAVSFDTETGAWSGEGERVDRAARRAAVLGGPIEAIQRDEHGRPIETAPPPAPADDAAPDDGAADGDESGEAAPVDPDAPASDQGDEDVADPADAAAAEGDQEPPPEPPEVARYRAELEQARAELAEARFAADRAVRRGPDTDEFDRYHDDPAGWIRTRVAEVLGVDAEHPLVEQEMGDLFGELTFASISPQDIPEQQQAQLRAGRVDRKLRLQSHRRQASQRAQQTSALEERARNHATSVFDAVASQFPAARLAERRFGRPLGALIVERLQRGVIEGSIQNWDTKADTDLFTEAIRLLDSDTRTWAANLGPQLAHLIPAPAPGAPGASSQTKPPQTPTSPPAPPKGTTAKPRTLPPQQAGAAPSRPGAPRKQEPLSRDPEIRRRQILERHRGK